jgi:hypothetical protein
MNLVFSLKASDQIFRRPNGSTGLLHDKEKITRETGYNNKFQPFIIFHPIYLVLEYGTSHAPKIRSDVVVPRAFTLEYSLEFLFFFLMMEQATRAI